MLQQVAHRETQNSLYLQPSDYKRVPTSVVMGQKRFLTQAHIKWAVNNVLIKATKYARLPVSGERIFWVPNREETLANHKSLQIPVYLFPKKNKTQIFFNCLLKEFSPKDSKESYISALQKSINSTNVAISVENFPFSDIGSSTILEQIAASWASQEDQQLMLQSSEWIQIKRADGSIIQTNKAILRFNHFPLSILSYLSLHPKSVHSVSFNPRDFTSPRFNTNTTNEVCNLCGLKGHPAAKCSPFNITHNNQSKSSTYVWRVKSNSVTTTTSPPSLDNVWDPNFLKNKGNPTTTAFSTPPSNQPLAADKSSISNSVDSQPIEPPTTTAATMTTTTQLLKQP